MYFEPYFSWHQQEKEEEEEQGEEEEEEQEEQEEQEEEEDSPACSAVAPSPGAGQVWPRRGQTWPCRTPSQTSPSPTCTETPRCEARLTPTLRTGGREAGCSAAAPRAPRPGDAGGPSPGTD